MIFFICLLFVFFLFDISFLLSFTFLLFIVHSSFSILLSVFNFHYSFSFSSFVFFTIIFYYYFHVGVIRRWHGPGSVSLLPDPHTGPVHVLKSYQVRAISIFCVEHCIFYYHLNNLHYAIIIVNYFKYLNIYMSLNKRALFLQFFIFSLKFSFQNYF